MKKLIITASLGLMIPLMSMGQSTLGAGTLGSTLATSPHDFSGAAWNPTLGGVYNGQIGGQLCQPCHTPHNANLTITTAPLWNRQMTTSTYVMYVGVEMQSTQDAAPSGMSQLCLSCHDGSVALGSFGGQVGTTFLTGGAKLDVDLRNDHPISMVYDAALVAADGELHPITDSYDGSHLISDRLDANSKVQCTSCHGVHANANGYFLRKSNQGSALCLTCHVK